MKAPDNLETLEHGELIQLVKQLLARVSALEEENVDLKRRLNQDSGNSSQPPSRDRYPRKLKKLGGKKGPPAGHDGITRFGFGEPDQVKDLLPLHCGCGHSLEHLPTTLKDTWQVAEWVKPVEVTAYRRFRALCPSCGEMNVAPWPEQVIPGQSIGPKLTAWLTRQKSLPKPTARLKKRILSQPARVFYFVTHPETPPDNNAAERALRGLVTNRKTTGGNRTEAGERLKTTLFSIVPTCQKQAHDAIEYIQKALLATAHPSLPYPQLFMHAE